MYKNKGGERMLYRQEQKIEKYLSKMAKYKGGYAMKITSPGFAGVPDRLVLFKGVATFVELKAPNGVPTKRQAAVHKLLAGWGFPVKVINSKQGVDTLLKELEAQTDGI